jgi:hypothetical protein
MTTSAKQIHEFMCKKFMQKKKYMLLMTNLLFSILNIKIYVIIIALELKIESYYTIKESITYFVKV